MFSFTAGLPEFYAVALGIGFVYICFGFFLGAGHFGEGGHGMDAGHGHGIDTGHGHIGGHGHHTGDGGNIGHGHDGADTHGHTTPSHAHGHDGQGHGDGSDAGGQHDHDGSRPDRSHLIITAPSSTDTIYFTLMRLLSPMTLAIFLFWFGSAGFLTLHYFSALQFLSLAPALVAGFIGTTLTQQMMSALMRKMQATSSYTLQDVPGTMGELTVSIPENGTGEVTFTMGGTRSNFPAKCGKSGRAIKRGTRVVIMSVENNIMYVEPYDEVMSDSTTLAIPPAAPANQMDGQKETNNG